jgi:aminocarboxymuconate-semialdehyde decarboxylase
VNAALAEVVAAHPRLRPVYAVHLGPGADPAGDIAGLPGPTPAVLVNTHPPGVTSLADPAIEPLWEALATAGIPALVHPPANGPSCSFTPPVLQNITGRLVDTSTAVLELVLGGVLDRHHDLDLLVVHGGGLLPYQAFRLDGLERAGLLARTGTSTRASEVLRRLWYDTVALDPASIELLVRRVGPDRVLLGSDAPFAIGDPDPVGTLRGCDLPPETMRAVCGGNARRLGRLTASPAGDPGDGGPG